MADSENVILAVKMNVCPRLSAKDVSTLARLCLANFNGDLLM